MKFQETSPAQTFSDTAGTYWESAILKLHAAGVYLGNDGKALPSDTITRQQAVTMIARAFDITGSDTAALPYGDEALIADYARGCCGGDVGPGLHYRFLERRFPSYRPHYPGRRS